MPKLVTLQYSGPNRDKFGMPEPYFSYLVLAGDDASRRNAHFAVAVPLSGDGARVRRREGETQAKAIAAVEESLDVLHRGLNKRRGERSAAPLLRHFKA